jgi:hypothetical protein
MLKRGTYKRLPFLRRVLCFWGVQEETGASIDFDRGIIYIPDLSWELYAFDDDCERLTPEDHGEELFDSVGAFRFYHPDLSREEERIVERACALVCHVDFE